MGRRKGQKNTLSKFCFLRDDENLRQTLAFMIEQTGKRKYHLSLEMGIPNYRMSRYLNGLKGNTLSQFQVLIMCEYFNIEPELKIKYIDNE